MNIFKSFCFHLPKKGAGANPQKSAPAQKFKSGPAPAKKPRLRLRNPDYTSTV